MKWQVGANRREAIRRVFTEVLGATAVTPRENMDAYVLADGASVGVFYSNEVLSEADARLGAWLEFLVTDVGEAARALTALGIERVDYDDKTHPYFQAPGGPVFRLAAAGS